MKKRFAVIVVAVLFLLNLQNVAWGQSVDGRIYQKGQPAPHVLVIFSRGDAEVARAITGSHCNGFQFFKLGGGQR